MQVKVRQKKMMLWIMAVKRVWMELYLSGGRTRDVWVREWKSLGFGGNGSIVHWNGKGGEGANF